jgi:hypothetical protein
MRDRVLAALDADLAQSREEICEETRLDSRQVGNALDQLQRSGKCRRGTDGWTRTDSTRPPIASASPKRRGRPPKAETMSARAKPKPAQYKAPAIVVAANGNLRYALTESREIAIERTDGSGERGLIGARDALRLAEFIAMVRPALEGA